MKHKVVVLGSHKGLGYHCVKSLLALDSVDKVLGFSRFESGDFVHDEKYQFYAYDFTKVYGHQELFQNLWHVLQEFKPTHIIYCAGGGPYGLFKDKAWKDHEWALKLNFLFPAHLLWHLSQNLEPCSFTFVGSAIAESSTGDAMGPSYTAAKWAMKGLIRSINNQQPSLKINIFSPGYMDTDLLPQGAKPRQIEGLVRDPSLLAKELLSELGLWQKV